MLASQAFIAKTPLQSRTSLATLMWVVCSMSQCELRSTFPNVRVTNVIRIVTYYTLPPVESPDSSWMTRSQRTRRRDKDLWHPTYMHSFIISHSSCAEQYMATCLRTNRLTHSHTIKPPTAGVRHVGHTSIACVYLIKCIRTYSETSF